LVIDKSRAFAAPARVVLLRNPAHPLHQARMTRLARYRFTPERVRALSGMAMIA
jgi:hypothetical protein